MVRKPEISWRQAAILLAAGAVLMLGMQWLFGPGDGDTLDAAADAAYETEETYDLTYTQQSAMVDLAKQICPVLVDLDINEIAVHFMTPLKVAQMHYAGARVYPADNFGWALFVDVKLEENGRWIEGYGFEAPRHWFQIGFGDRTGIVLRNDTAKTCGISGGEALTGLNGATKHEDVFIANATIEEAIGNVLSDG